MAVGTCVRIPLLWFLLALAPNTGVAEITPVWTLGTNGATVIEAENVNTALDGSAWVTEVEREGYLGPGYLRLETDRPGSPWRSLAYHFQIDDEGSYRLGVRLVSPDDHSAQTEILRAVDDQGQVVAINDRRSDEPSEDATPESNWRILSSTSPWTLSPGIHRLEITHGLGGILLDRLFIHSDQSEPPAPDADPSPLIFPLEFDDLKPPSPPRNLRLKSHGSAHLYLLWDASEDEDSAVLGYDVYWRRRWIGRSFRPEYIMGHLDPYSLYHVNVQAVDLGGNTSRATSLIAETSPFELANGVSVKSMTSPFEIDGHLESTWEQQRLYKLSGPNNQSGPATMRLAWSASKFHLLVTAPENTAPQLELSFDPQFNQAGWRTGEHPVLTLPMPVSFSSQNIHHATQVIEGQRTHEVAIHWEALKITPVSSRLLGLNVVCRASEGQATAAWRWDDAHQAPAKKPYQFGVVRLVEGIPSGDEKEWMPPNIWRERDGYVIVEAESIDHDPAWQVQTSGEGHCGEGRLDWTHPTHYPAQSSSPDELDFTTEKQGLQNKWLIVRVYTSEPGAYRCNVRFRRLDTAQRAWLWRVGQSTTNETAISSIGLNPNTPESSTGTYAWSDHGSREFLLKRGINNLYLSPSTARCSIDRIVLFRVRSSLAEERAMAPETFASQAFR